MDMVTLVGVVLIIAVYCLPYLVARIRGHNNATAIGNLNALLGWTAIGWIVALVWASTDNVKKSDKNRKESNYNE